MSDPQISSKEPTPPLEPVPPPQPSLLKRFIRVLLGRPLSSSQMEHTLLPKFLALPVFSSDAISSVAYATQEILLVLGGAGLWISSAQPLYSHYTMLITTLIVILLAIVVASYWQTIHGYPNGGGSYIVAKDNLKPRFMPDLPGLIAASALLIDYVLTVAVSIASGVQNLESLPLPPWLQWLHFDHLVLWCLLFIGLLTLANLRGLKESGSMFAIFTYGFVIMCYLMIFLGVFGHAFLGWHVHPQYANQRWWDGSTAQSPGANTMGTVGLFLLLSAFANGCSAMTGTEAVSNGIPAFREPKSHNAAWTLIYMGIILGSILLGISYLAVNFHVVYWEHAGQTAPAVIDQISGTVFGKTGRWQFLYWAAQFFTAAILVLAANTSYADFPRLSSILARDRYMPKQMANLGDKLVFTNGILLLGLFASLLIVWKKGNVDALIPLYAIGVFTAFTLSQAGMVVHWYNLRKVVRGWQVKAFFNGLGAVATGLVFIDLIIEKSPEGAWIVLILVPIMVYLFKRIHAHYEEVAKLLTLDNYCPPKEPQKNIVLVLVPTLHRGVMQALEYARSISSDCRAVHVCVNPEETPRLIQRWEQWVHDVPLVILNSPYRTLIEPIMRYLDAIHLERPNTTITVVIPEFVPPKWWHAFLHGQSAARLKLALLGREDVVVTNVRYFLHPCEEGTSPKMLNNPTLLPQKQTGAVK
ncbi:MAG TPA: APC family permease [Chthonomonas sp.]|uniref:APC family permease n=1 Tax=Chthonomonas sp. TaxID=2282153 RepID=UPI002B4AEEE2|nr:APC family permease [Chthonomonas sp.]HLI49095.1 APC family permease [Chthonomonas sp.]